MPVRKQDAHRALELLEDYHAKLTKPGDRQLRAAIERVIRIFKSRLFQALLDIQEFYEVTLQDGTKTTDQKTRETVEIANKWEEHAPLTSRKPTEKYRPEDQEFPPPPPELDGSPKLVPVVGKETPGVQSVQSYPASVKLSPAKVNGAPDDWEYEEIVLERVSGVSMPSVYPALRGETWNRPCSRDQLGIKNGKGPGFMNDFAVQEESVMSVPMAMSAPPAAPPVGNDVYSTVDKGKVDILDSYAGKPPEPLMVSEDETITRHPNDPCHRFQPGDLQRRWI